MSGRRERLRTAEFAYPAQDSSLDQDDCSSLRDTVKSLAPEWSADVHKDPGGELSLMIMPPDVDDMIGPLLVVHKVASMFRLDQFRWDSYSNVGDYRTFDGLLDAVRRTLLSLPAVSGIGCTLH
jgi:hypothetical protein